MSHCEGIRARGSRRGEELGIDDLRLGVGSFWGGSFQMEMIVRLVETGGVSMRESGNP